MMRSCCAFASDKRPCRQKDSTPSKTSLKILPEEHIQNDVQEQLKVLPADLVQAILAFYGLNLRDTDFMHEKPFHNYVLRVLFGYQSGKREAVFFVFSCVAIRAENCTIERTSEQQRMQLQNTLVACLSNGVKVSINGFSEVLDERLQNLLRTALALAMPKNQNLLELDLSNNNLTNAEFLADTLRDSTNALCSISLASNTLDSTDEITEALQASGRQMYKVDLSNNFLDLNAHVALGMLGTQIRQLILGSNSLEERCLEPFVDAYCLACKDTPVYCRQVLQIDGRGLTAHSLVALLLCSSLKLLVPWNDLELDEEMLAAELSARQTQEIHHPLELDLGHVGLDGSEPILEVLSHIDWRQIAIKLSKE